MTDASRLSPKVAFDDDRPIIYYLHGNGGARGGPHRNGLYKVLAYRDDLDYHIVSIDYRGYGDSTNEQPTVHGLSTDAASGYFWLLDQIKGNTSRVTVWGHSLGTGIATYFVSSLQVRDQPNGLLLESPFSSMADAVSHHPFTVLFKWLPYFEAFFVEPIVNNEKTNFDTSSKIGDVHCPLLILHAVDDVIVPYPLGVKLHQIALKSRPADSVPAKMVSFDAVYRYGHKNIYKDASIPAIVADFVAIRSIG